MFFKKNKPEKPQGTGQQASEAFGSPADVSASFSVFAPGLNPAAAPIDFGFDRSPSPPSNSYVVPAPPPDNFSPPQPQPVEPDWNANPAPPAEDFFTQPPTQENWESTPQNAVPAAPFVDTPAPAWEAPVSSVPTVDFSSDVPENTAYLGETFENYTTQAQSVELDAATWESPSGMVESPYNPSRFENPAGFETPAFNQEMPELMPPAGFEPPGVALEPFSDFSASFESSPAYAPEPLVNNSPTTGDLMPWEQPTVNAENFEPPASPETLWQNLDSSQTPPGEQVPLSPGGMMDAMHQKLYPEDPFHSEQADLLEGHQAFEDAAQFLFPDTMNASLDWQEDIVGPAQYELPAEFQLPDEVGFPSSPVDLGPSMQSDPSSLSDITSFYPEESQPVAPEPVTSPLPADDPFAFPLAQEADFFSLDESVGLTPAFELPPVETMESLDSGFSIPGAFDAPGLPYEVTTPEAIHWAPAEYPETTPDFHLITPPEAKLEPPAPVYFPEVTPATSEGFSLAPMSDDALDAAIPQWQPSQEPLTPANEPTITGSPEWSMPEEALGPAVTPLEYSPTDDWFESETTLEEATLGQPSPDFTGSHFEALPDVQSAYSEQPAMPQLLSDQDFYATDFTLNEFGELVPSSDSAASPMSAANLPLPIQAGTNWMPEPSLPTGELEPAAIPDYLAPPMQEPVSGFQTAILTNEALPIEFVEQEPDAFFEDWFAESAAPSMETTLPAFSPAAEKPMLSFGEPEASLPDFLMEETVQPLPDFTAEEAMPPLPSEASGFLPDASASPFAQIPLPPMPQARPPEMPTLPAPAQPLPTQQAQPQPQHPPDSLEGQWQHTPVAEPAKTTQAGTVKPPAGFSLGNVEVLGVCPLAEDRRLLVVNSGGVFALMGQVGLEEPQITVLKIFENNPLAYQNTFTAVAEAPGMFVTQVGTWHAIVSTFQDKITLHTELG